MTLTSRQALRLQQEKCPHYSGSQSHENPFLHCFSFLKQNSLEGKGKLPLCILFCKVLQFVLQLCYVFYSCAFSFADVLKLCTIPTYNFADVQKKYLLCYIFCSCTFSLSVVNCFRSCTIFSLAFLGNRTVAGSDMSQFPELVLLFTKY